MNRRNCDAPVHQVGALLFRRVGIDLTYLTGKDCLPILSARQDRIP